MPQRFLRPGIRTSDAWNSVSFGAQSLYIRLLTLVDDFGRYDGRIPVLHGECFALRPDVKAQQTAAFRSELQKAYLVDVYSVEGKEYVQVLKWQERARSDKSKYPDPQDSAADRRIPQEKDASLVPRSSPLHHRSSPSAPPAPEPLDFLEELKKNHAYEGIDIDREIGKMQAWLLTPKGKRRKLNKAFVVNWLNRADPEMDIPNSGPQYRDIKWVN